VNDEILPQGFNEVVWRSRNSSGHQLPSGTYFYCLEAGEYRQTKRMILLK